MKIHRQRFLFVLLLGALVGVARTAAADPVTVVTFDDLTGNNLPVPNGYGGVNWLHSWTHYGFSQEPYTPHSHPQRVYETYGPVSADFEFVSPNQLFSGAWFSGVSRRIGGTAPAHVWFNLYNDGMLVHTSSLLTPSNKPAFLPGGYAGRIDRVEVRSNNPGYWIMDDVTYGTTAVPTPEPGSMLLLPSGVAALCLRKIHRGGSS